MIINSPKNLASVITYHRKNKKLSQTEVGGLVNLKQKTISAIENTPESSKIETLFRVLSALNLDLIIKPKDEDNNDWKEEW